MTEDVFVELESARTCNIFKRSTSSSRLQDHRRILNQHLQAGRQALSQVIQNEEDNPKKVYFLIRFQQEEIGTGFFVSFVDLFSQKNVCLTEWNKGQFQSKIENLKPI